LTGAVPHVECPKYCEFYLGAGAIGQTLLLGRSSHVLTRILFALFLVPWLIVWAISFGRRPPSGPGKFRRCLTLAMCWYAVVTALVETRYCLLPAEPNKHIQVAIAQVLVGLVAAGFVVFIRAWLGLRRYEISLRIASRP
jgi:hypothetical protein